MDYTPNLNLPYILSGQTQKHLSYNEALGILDSLCQLSCKSMTITTPVDNAEDGHSYIIPIESTGEWVDRLGQIALWQTDGWTYLHPQTGWRAWIEDENTLYIFDGSLWNAFSQATAEGGSYDSINLEETDFLGINTVADTTNRLSVASGASLFTHEGADHRLVINKNTAADTASLIFQTGYEGRAEFGLAGNDQFSLKVSSDNVNWQNALTVDADTGEVNFPNSNFLSEFPAQTNIFGINTSADTRNRLSVASPSSLFTHEGSDHKQYFNKNTETDTTSLIFQSNWQSYAELGLIENNNLSLKVSSDNTTWHSAFEINASNGEIIFPNTTFATASGSSSANILAAAHDNLLINPNFYINQRQFSGGSLAQNSYGYDRWRSGTSDTSISYSNGITTLNSGIIEQPIDLRGRILPAGTKLSFIIEGHNGADIQFEFAGHTHVFSSNGMTHSFQFTLTNDTVETEVLKLIANNGAASYSRVGLFKGYFEQISLALSFSENLDKCLPFYQKSFDYDLAPSSGDDNTIWTGYAHDTTSAFLQWISFSQNMYQKPNIKFYSSIYSTPNTNMLSIYQPDRGWHSFATSSFKTSSNGFLTSITRSGFAPNTPLYGAGGWTADAEIY